MRSGLAGGLAGVSAKTLIAPLDRVKILFQTNNFHYRKYIGTWSGLFKAISHIYNHDGIPGLYQGHSATLLRIFPYAAIKFVCYEQYRSHIIPSDLHETAFRRILTGSLAGMTSVFCTYPLDLIRVRLAFETTHHNHNSLTHILKLIYTEHPPPPPFNLPIANFYRGFIPTIIGMIPYAGVSFYSHDLLHDILRSNLLSPYTIQINEKRSNSNSNSNSHSNRQPLKTWAQLLAGGFAGMLAQTSAYPFEIIRRRMQVAGATGIRLSLKGTCIQIWSERGFKGFYVGLGIGFVKVVPMFACSFFVYERCKWWLGI